jgi:hypothetical protein
LAHCDLETGQVGARTLQDRLQYLFDAFRREYQPIDLGERRERAELPPEPIGHVVHRVSERGEFVAARDLHSRGEVLCRNALRRRYEATEWPERPADMHDRRQRDQD